MDGFLLQIPALDSTTKWLLVVAAALTIFYAVMRPLRKKKDPLARPAHKGGLASERAVERDMNHLLVELSGMARQITAQLDTRTLKLEMLMKEADERIAALQTAVQTTSAMPSSAPISDSVSTPLPEAPPRVDPRHGEVYQMADEGRSPHEIAHQLSRPQGEVELILALRDRVAES